MPKKCKCPPPGAPEWLVTFGDMMSLLLTFFILLLSLSEIKKEDEFRAIVREVQKAFGMKGGGGKLPTKDDPALSMPKRLEEIQLKSQKEPNMSNAEDPGMDGREVQVTTIREGDLFSVGGRITFEPGSADLREEVKQRLLQVADEIRGLNTKLELRGHAASMEMRADSRYGDLWSLSHARAKSVMDFLTSDEVGLRSERFRLIAAADQEPLKQRVYDPSTQEPNRRVEVLMRNNLVGDFTKPQMGGGF